MNKHRLILIILFSLLIDKARKTVTKVTCLVLLFPSPCDSSFDLEPINFRRRGVVQMNSDPGYPRLFHAQYALSSMTIRVFLSDLWGQERLTNSSLWRTSIVPKKFFPLGSLERNSLGLFTLRADTFPVMAWQWFCSYVWIAKVFRQKFYPFPHFNKFLKRTNRFSKIGISQMNYTFNDWGPFNMVKPVSWNSTSA